MLRLLRSFQDHEMIRVNQVAREMGLSRSTVHRMLATLSHHRFVEQDEFSRAYKPGPALVDIGLSVVQNIDIRALAHGVLVDLRDETNETVHLAHLRGTDVLFLDSVESTRTVRTSGRTGKVLPAHATAAGKVLLAHKSDAELDALYPSGTMAAPTPRAVTTLEELREQLAEVRRLEYAANDAESEDDVSAVAAAVRDKRGRVRGAIATTAPRSRCDDEWIRTTAAMTIRAAQDLGRRTG
ncbi:IclR family transcriptional regulator [Spirillospora sp. CA-253888]